MKKYLLIILFILKSGLINCTLSESNNNSSANNTNSIIYNDEPKEEHQSTSEISMNTLKQLEDFSIDSNYHMVGKIETAELKYTDMKFEDILHLIFIDKNNKDYDFNSNRTTIQLYVDSKDLENNTKGGFEPNNTYINKYFKVTWRKLKLNHKPQNEMEMYYEEYNEIIYLQEINNK